MANKYFARFQYLANNTTILSKKQELPSLKYAISLTNITKKRVKGYMHQADFIYFLKKN